MDFSKAQYGLPSASGPHTNQFFPFVTQDSTSSVYFYLAIPTPKIDDTVLESIQLLISKSETTPPFKKRLENVLMEKRAYKLSMDKQKYVDNEMQELFPHGHLQLLLSPRRMEVLGCALIIEA